MVQVLTARAEALLGLPGEHRDHELPALLDGLRDVLEPGVLLDGQVVRGRQAAKDRERRNEPRLVTDEGCHEGVAGRFVVAFHHGCVDTRIEERVTRHLSCVALREKRRS